MKIPRLGMEETGVELIMGILATPPKATPPINKALLRDYENPLVSLSEAGYDQAGYFFGVSTWPSGGKPLDSP